MTIIPGCQSNIYHVRQPFAAGYAVTQVTRLTDRHGRERWECSWCGTYCKHIEAVKAQEEC